jgi:hypothetical protein
MIEMKSPSFAFNSVDVPGPSYRMWRWTEGHEGMTTAMLVDKILWANSEALSQFGGRLQNIVINSHGREKGGEIDIGGQKYVGIYSGTVNEFLRLKGKNLGTIWLVACQAAKNAAGSNLCQMIAVNSGCLVIASDEDQEVGAWGTWRLWTSARINHIDEFEGSVYAFYPSGHKKLVDPHDDVFTIAEWKDTF